ncbi:MAG: GntR family transcriptional regulator [bacterium]|nr:GntR family transcriptional regulator [bacterium]
MEAVKKGAVRGEHAAGGQLPSVRDMAATMGVNANTMARAYQELEREGFVDTRRGEGSFVTADPDRIDEERRRLAAAASQQFCAQIRDLGLTAAQIRALLEQIKGETGQP